MSITPHITLHPFEPSQKPSATAFSADGEVFFVVSEFGELEAYDMARISDEDVEPLWSREVELYNPRLGVGPESVVWLKDRASETSFVFDIRTGDAVSEANISHSEDEELEKDRAISPDGSRVAEVAGVPLSLTIYDLKGDSEPQSPDNAQTLRAPTWSPDGTQLVALGFQMGTGASTGVHFFEISVH